MKGMNDKGFSLVELIITIAIMAVLASVITAVYLGHLSNAKKTRAEVNAKTLYKAAQVAVIEASAAEPEAFRYAMKFEEVIDGETVRMARFSNQSLYKFLQESKGAGSLSSAYSKACDYRIAQNLVSSIPGADSEVSDTTLKDKSPIGDSSSTKSMSDHPEIYGDVVFGFAYDELGKIIYFQCIYDGYFTTIDSTGSHVERVSDSTFFNDWPRTRAEGTNKW